MLSISHFINYSSSLAIFSASANAKPVPAGIKPPMIIFSFNPSSVSFLPRIAASVNTRVVSWNDAADKNESDFNDARVIPSKTGFTTGGCLPFSTHSFT